MHLHHSKKLIFRIDVYKSNHSASTFSSSPASNTIFLNTNVFYGGERTRLRKFLNLTSIPSNNIPISHNTQKSAAVEMIRNVLFVKNISYCLKASRDCLIIQKKFIHLTISIATLPFFAKSQHMRISQIS